ncbi:hypothetical protein CDD81_162 [Ophiocordyceps australis]|uniref:ER-bound oxygenase mpaB/mpaB'/Rubber oxygenase catalytic domain-containing protein n=1 Tax=Ophiocordyceps australis TaxID=1399860 RepID=A0A2C5YJA9_9HYPO|nr:hypothetical protein CDD81_162 [Ophiocordyceps australis]
MAMSCPVLHAESEGVNEVKAGAISIPVLRHTFGRFIYWSGMPLAALLQLAHPAVARGVCKHSRFRQDPYSRCHRSIVFLVAVMYGTEGEREAICGVVRRQHGRVKGVGYEANDAELQRWVAATGLVATVKVHETFLGAMEQHEQEALCVEFGMFGTQLGMPASAWFSSWGEFEHYWTGMVQELKVSDEGRELGRMILYELLPWYLGWVQWVVRIFVAAWLPEKFARGFGLERGMVACMSFRVLAGLGWILYLLVPVVVWRMATLVLVHDMQRVAAEVVKSQRWSI